MADDLLLLRTGDYLLLRTGDRLILRVESTPISDICPDPEIIGRPSKQSIVGRPFKITIVKTCES